MRRVRLSPFVLLLVPLLVVSAWTPSDALEAWRLYDDFEVGPISFTKWKGESEGDSHIYAMDRTIVLDPSGVGRDLRLMHVGHGDDVDNTNSVETHVGLEFAQPDTVTAMRARFNVRNVSVLQPCIANTNETTDANIAIGGSFFNIDTTTATPGDYTGDVRAAVFVTRSTGNGTSGQLLARGFVALCRDSTCSWQNRRYFSPLNASTTDDFDFNLGAASIGSWIRLAVQWDRDNNKFIFQRGTGTPVEVSYASVAGPNLGAPAVTGKKVLTANFSANCTTSNSQGTAKMDVLVDNVAVNQTALP